MSSSIGPSKNRPITNDKILPDKASDQQPPALHTRYTKASPFGGPGTPDPAAPSRSAASESATTQRRRTGVLAGMQRASVRTEGHDSYQMVVSPRHHDTEAQRTEDGDPLDRQMTLMSDETRQAYATMCTAKAHAARLDADPTASQEDKDAANLAVIDRTHDWVTEAAAEVRYRTSGPNRLTMPSGKTLMANIASQALSNLLVFSLSSAVGIGLKAALKDSISTLGATGATAGTMALMLSLAADLPALARRKLGGAEAEVQLSLGYHNNKGLYKKIAGNLSLTTLAVLLHGATNVLITAEQPLSHTLPGGQIGRGVASGLAMAVGTQGIIHGLAKLTQHRAGVSHAKYLPEPHSREDVDGVVLREDAKVTDRTTWGHKGKEVVMRTLASVAGVAVYFAIASQINAKEDSIRDSTTDQNQINKAQVDTQAATIFGAYFAMFSVIAMVQGLGTLLGFDPKRHIPRFAKPANELQIRQIRESAQVATMAMIQHLSVAMDRGSLGPVDQKKMQDLAEVLGGRTYRETQDGKQDGQAKIAGAYTELRSVADEVVDLSNSGDWKLTDGTLMQIAHNLYTAADSLEIAERNYLPPAEGEGTGKGKVKVGTAPPEGDGAALFPELSSAVHGLRDIRHMLLQCLVQVGGDASEAVDGRLQELAKMLLPTLAAVDKVDRMAKGLAFNQALASAKREQDHFDHQGKLQTVIGAVTERRLDGNPGAGTLDKLAGMLGGGGTIDAAVQIMLDTKQPPGVVNDLLEKLMRLKYGGTIDDGRAQAKILGDPAGARMLLLLNKLNHGQPAPSTAGQGPAQAGTGLPPHDQGMAFHLDRFRQLDHLSQAQARADSTRRNLQEEIRTRNDDLRTLRAAIQAALAAQASPTAQGGTQAAQAAQGDIHAAEEGRSAAHRPLADLRRDEAALVGEIATRNTTIAGLDATARNELHQARQLAPQAVQDFVSAFQRGKISMDELHDGVLSKLDAPASDERDTDASALPSGRAGPSGSTAAPEQGDPVRQFREQLPQAFLTTLRNEHKPVIEKPDDLGADLLTKLWSDMEKAPELRQDAIKAAMSLPVLLHIPGVPMHYQKDIHAHLTNYNGVITNMARQAMENKANRVEAQLNAAIPHQIPNSTGEKKYYTVIQRLMDYVNRDYALAQGWLHMSENQQMRVLELAMRYSNDPAENIQVTSTGGDPTDKNSQKRELAHLERAFRNTGVPIKMVGETTLDKEQVKTVTPRRIRVAAESSVATITETVNTGKVFLLHADGGSSHLAKRSNTDSLDQLFRDVNTMLEFPSADSVRGQPGLGDLAEMYALLIHAHGPGLGKTIADKPDHVRYIDDKLTEINNRFGDKGELNIDLSWDFVGHYICENQYDVMKHNNVSPKIQQALQNVLKSYRAFDSVGAPSDKADDVSQVDQAGEWRVGSDNVAGLHFEALSSYLAVVKEEFKNPAVRDAFRQMLQNRGDRGNNWLYLINKHKERFLYGSDTLAPGIKAHGQSAYALNSRMLEPMYVLFDELKKHFPDDFKDEDGNEFDVANLVARGNFERVLNDPRMEQRRDAYSRQTAEGAGVWGSGPVRPNPRTGPADLPFQEATQPRQRVRRSGGGDEETDA
jgi:hypothetical protein